jgi:hypothetical protein
MDRAHFVERIGKSLENADDAQIIDRAPNRVAPASGLQVNLKVRQALIQPPFKPPPGCAN